MSTPVHPRRSSYKAQGRAVTPPSDGLVYLPKTPTFHSRKGFNSDILEHATPKRSATCPKDLEDLLDPRQVQVKRMLDNFDKAVSSRSPLPVNADILSEDDVLPVPRFLLDRQMMVGRAQLPTPPNDPMEIDEKLPVVDHTHVSDSGLGTSVSESRMDLSGAARAGPRSTQSSVTSSYTALTKSVLAGNSDGHVLSEKACRHIKRNIVDPILKEESLKDFHPLIKDVPRRIGAKSITTLRDLEKTLTFLAPEFSVTDKSYLLFCSVAIRAVQTTSTVLNDQDLRRPTDAPYTNGYFLNLWDQIHRFAAIIAATREKEAKGEPLDTMDYSRDEKIALRGGLSHDGRPLELVREKDGKVIPIAEGSECVSPFKRSFDDEDDAEGVLRSMARRRKSDKPGDVVHPCTHPGCDKVFKRNCDLGKHEKTHTRPFKCTDSKCKFNAYGFPTEKERDRHENDKHSANPVMYKCDEPGCTYSSKRESNCKQHKEKAHNWNYIRSKSNGKRKSSDAAAGPSRLSSTPVTPYTPASGVNSSPSVHSYRDFQQPLPMYQFTPAVGAEDFQTGRRQSAATTGTSSGYSPLEPLSATPFTPEDAPLFPSNLGVSLTYPWPQQPTPALSTGTGYDEMHVTDNMPFSFNTAPHIPQMSPGAHDQVLYSPHDLAMDEGLGGDEFDYGALTGGDFTLFDNSATVTAGPSNYSNTQPSLFSQDTSGPFGAFSNPLEPLFGSLDTMSQGEIDALLQHWGDEHRQ